MPLDPSQDSKERPPHGAERPLGTGDASAGFDAPSGPNPAAGGTPWGAYAQRPYGRAHVERITSGRAVVGAIGFFAYGLSVLVEAAMRPAGPALALLTSVVLFASMACAAAGMFGLGGAGKLGGVGALLLLLAYLFVFLTAATRSPALITLTLYAAIPSIALGSILVGVGGLTSGHQMGPVALVGGGLWCLVGAADLLMFVLMLGSGGQTAISPGVGVAIQLATAAAGATMGGGLLAAPGRAPT